MKTQMNSLLDKYLCECCNLKLNELKVLFYEFQDVNPKTEDIWACLGALGQLIKQRKQQPK